MMQFRLGIQAALSGRCWFAATPGDFPEKKFQD
jgi:hypothetical protein